MGYPDIPKFQTAKRWYWPKIRPGMLSTCPQKWRFWSFLGAQQRFTELHLLIIQCQEYQVTWPIPIWTLSFCVKPGLWIAYRTSVFGRWLDFRGYNHFQWLEPEIQPFFLRETTQIPTTWAGWGWNSYRLAGHLQPLSKKWWNMSQLVFEKRRALRWYPHIIIIPTISNEITIFMLLKPRCVTI